MLTYSSEGLDAARERKIRRAACDGHRRFQFISRAHLGPTAVRGPFEDPLQEYLLYAVVFGDRNNKACTK